MDKTPQGFDKSRLGKLILPLVIEQVLAVLVGMADIAMVSFVGQDALAGVSLVDQISYLILTAFSALATGGAVVASQFMGKGKKEDACIAANQLVLSVGAISLLLTFLAYFFRSGILTMIYNTIEPGVRRNAEIYFQITSLSYPFLGIYNAAASLRRAEGDSLSSMLSSLLMNVLNIGGNALLIFAFHFGVEGVAYPTLFSRIVAAVVMVCILRDPSKPIHIDRRFRLGWNPAMIRRILQIGIPTGLDSSLFQIGKLLVASLISALGTNAIAANATAGTLAGFMIIPGSAISLAMITVIGQDIGSASFGEARKDTRKLMGITYVSMLLLNGLVLIFLHPLLGIFHINADAYRMAYEVAFLHAISAVLFWPTSFALPSALRSGGDAAFIMIISAVSMWVFRIGFSYLLVALGMGLTGIWVAMFIDWIFRGIIFVPRYLGKRWIKVL